MMDKITETQLSLPSEREMLILRSFKAPRELVWKMWTEAEHLKHWWGPEGWTLPVCEVDLRVGGAWFYCMQSPPEMDMTSCGKAIYKEIVAPERLVYTDAFADADGNVNEDMPVATNFVDFVEEDGWTTVKSLTQYPTQAERDEVVKMGVEAGISQTYSRLDAYLETL